VRQPAISRPIDMTVCVIIRCFAGDAGRNPVKVFVIHINFVRMLEFRSKFAGVISSDTIITFSKFYY